LFSHLHPHLPCLQTAAPPGSSGAPCAPPAIRQMSGWMLRQEALQILMLQPFVGCPRSVPCCPKEFHGMPCPSIEFLTTGPCQKTSAHCKS
jgi:hypothetical protein